MNIEQRNAAILKALRDQTDRLNALPPEEAKAEAIRHLIEIGVLDKNGDPIPFDEEEFRRSNHPDNFRRIFNGVLD